ALDGVPHTAGDDRIEDLVQQFDLGPEDVARAVAAARDRARLRSTDIDPEADPKMDLKIAADDLWEACREQAGGALDELAQRIVPVYDWDDIVLPDDVVRQLREI